MPELPEVETIVQRLKNLVASKKVAEIEVLREKSFSGDLQNIVGVMISDVTRRAKLIRIHLSNDLSLLVHLKMTGQLIYVDDEIRMGGGHPTSDWVQDLPSSHTRVVIRFSDDSTLFFNDQRVFGWVRAMDEKMLDNEFSKYGPDVNSPDFTFEYFWSRFDRRTITMKQFIMDNDVVAGVGNIYACDALNLAMINPFRRANEINRDEAKRIYEAMRKVINLGIKLKGATISDYKNVDGFSGGYQDVALVYGKEGESCKNCGGKIIKEKLAGRGTYYCPSCQI